MAKNGLPSVFSCRSSERGPTRAESAWRLSQTMAVRSRKVSGARRRSLTGAPESRIRLEGPGQRSEAR